MKPSRFFRPFVIGVSAVVLVALTGPFAGPADADVTSVGGGAFAAQGDVTVLGLPAVTVGPEPVVTLPPTGGGPFEEELADVLVPLVLGIEALKAETAGSDLGTHQGTAASEAEVAGIELLPGIAGGVLDAGLINASCVSNGDGSSGSTQIIDGAAGGMPLPTLPAVDEIIDVIPGVLTVILNEQAETNTVGVETSISVNAIRISLNVPGVATADVILGQARCGAFGPDVLDPDAPPGPGEGASIPDGQIKRAKRGEPYIGDGVINTTGEFQKVKVNVNRRKKFKVRFDNNGDPGEWTYQGSVNDENFKLKYKTGAGFDVTQEVKAGTYQSATVPTGGLDDVIKVKIKAFPDSPIGSKRTATVTATSTEDPTHVDVVKGKMKHVG